MEIICWQRPDEVVDRKEWLLFYIPILVLSFFPYLSSSLRTSEMHWRKGLPASYHLSSSPRHHSPVPAMNTHMMINKKWRGTSPPVRFSHSSHTNSATLSLSPSSVPHLDQKQINKREMAGQMKDGERKDNGGMVWVSEASWRTRPH